MYLKILIYLVISAKAEKSEHFFLKKLKLIYYTKLFSVPDIFNVCNISAKDNIILNWVFLKLLVRQLPIIFPK